MNMNYPGFADMVLGLSRAELVYLAHAHRRALQTAEIRAKLTAQRHARIDADERTRGMWNQRGEDRVAILRGER